LHDRPEARAETQLRSAIVQSGVHGTPPDFAARRCYRMLPSTVNAPLNPGYFPPLVNRVSS